MDRCRRFDALLYYSKIWTGWSFPIFTLGKPDERQSDRVLPKWNRDRNILVSRNPSQAD